MDPELSSSSDEPEAVPPAGAPVRHASSLEHLRRRHHRFQRLVKRILNSHWFENLICAIIAVNALCHIGESSGRSSEAASEFWPVLEYVFLVIYTVELAVRIYAGGFSRHPLLHGR